jgi:hypothetical protein
MPRTVIYAIAIIGGAAFLGLLKLMYDMTGHMARMTDQVAAMSTDLGRMRTQMDSLVTEVAGIRVSVSRMDALSEDVRGMRRSMEAMAGVVQSGGEQIQRLNPMEMMQQMAPAPPRN